MTDIAVVLVNWNGCADLRAALHSVYGAPPACKYEVWVVDNASTDGSAEMVAREFPQARLIVNPANEGFSRANNAVLRATSSRYALLLNSDAAVHPGAIDAMIQFMDATPRTGILGPKVLNPDGSLQLSCRRFPTLGAGFFRNTLLGRLFPHNKYAGDYLMQDFDHASVRMVDWVSGCAMLLRRELIETVGVLDEAFYMYCEDVDICWRANHAGWDVTYSPGALVTHAIGRASDRNAEAMIWEFHRSWLLLDTKWHPKAWPLRKQIVWGGLWLRAWVRVLNRRRATRQHRRSETQGAA